MFTGAQIWSQFIYDVKLFYMDVNSRELSQTEHQVAPQST